MIKAYRRHRQVGDRDPRVIFRPGDRVLLKRRQPGKMKTRAEGPWTFLRYKNTAGWVAIVEGVHGRKLEVSSSNLIPVLGRQNLPALDPAVVWDDPPAEERFGVKRKRTVAPPDPPPATDPPPPPIPIWDNPLFHRSGPHDFSSSSDSEDNVMDDEGDFMGLQEAAWKLPQMRQQGSWPHLLTHRRTLAPPPPRQHEVRVLQRRRQVEAGWK